MIPITYVLFLSSILFSIGLLGAMINRRNLIQMLMAIELLLLATNINFIAFSSHLRDLTGQVFALFILTVSAAEAAIGLAILVVYYRSRDSIRVDELSEMKG